MRGVAGQEHPAYPVLGYLPLVVAEPGHPARIMHAKVRAEHKPGGPANLIQIDRFGVRHLTIPVPRDDAVQAVSERSEEGQTRLICIDLQHLSWRIGQLDVSQHHRAKDRPAGERYAELAPDSAVRSVCAHQICGPPRTGISGLGPKPHVGVPGVLKHVSDFCSAGKFGAERSRSPLEQALHLVLRRHQREREP